MRILYLEDEPNDAQLVALYVQTTPHNLVLATNTGDAKQALADPPDMIMVDVVLNNSREGYDFARELRAQGYQRPLIAITGLSTPRDMEECRKAGFNQVLSKPFAIKQLADIIGKYTS